MSTGLERCVSNAIIRFNKGLTGLFAIRKRPRETCRWGDSNKANVTFRGVRIFSLAQRHSFPCDRGCFSVPVLVLHSVMMTRAIESLVTATQCFYTA